MTFLATPRQFASVAEFETYIAGLTWSKGWRPSFVTGHNCGRPTLNQYLGYSPQTRRVWPGNLNRYYQGMGWHSGPALVIAPAVDGGGIWQLCDLEQDGVSVSCWNHKTIGIECIGDFETEDPNTGHGAEVRDTFVAVVAALCRRFGWRPRPQVFGVSGLHWHHQCPKDAHPCPGKRWDGEDVCRRIEAVLDGAAAAPNPAAADPAPHDAHWLQCSLNLLGSSPPLVVDGYPGPRTAAAVRAFQAAHGLTVDGLAGPLTIAAVDKALLGRVSA